MIKNLFKILLFVTLTGASAFAQTANPANNGLWSQPVQLSSAVQDGPPINLAGLGIAFHEFTWNKVGTLTGGAVELQYAESCSNPTWATLIAAETVTVNGGPTSMAHLSAGCVRFHASTAIAGSGYVLLRYNGFINDVTTVSGGGGGGGGGTTQDTDDNSIATGQDADLSIALGYVWNGVSWVRMTGSAGNGLAVDVARAALITGQTSLAGGNGVTTANTLRVSISSDTTGSLAVTNTGAFQVQCTSGCSSTAIADNANLSNINPMGALYDNTPPAIVDGNVGAPRMGSDRILLTASTVTGLAADGAAVSGNPVRIGGRDGSGNTQDIMTDTSGNQVVVGAGTAGAPSGGVISIQGVGGMTAVHVACDSGCTGGTTDTDDGTIAGAQVTGLQLDLGYVWDGAAWKRKTIGTAGTASAQVTTVQGIASMTPILATGTGTAGTAATGVLTVQGIASMTPLLVNGTGVAGTPTSGVLTVQGIASMTALIVDSELPAAATLGDATTNPSTTGVAAYNMCYNGATWDRCKSSTGGSGAIDANTQRITIATDDTAITKLTSLAPTTTGGLTGCYLVSTASTNSTSCKGSAGQIYHIRMINTTSTLYYLRLYNTASAPTCSSATGFIESIPIPHGSGAGGGFVDEVRLGVPYATGIGFCLTGGSSSTDNSNAATGVFGAIFYK